MDLGPSLELLLSFKEVAEMAGDGGDEKYPDLYGVPQLEGERLSPKVRDQARLYLQQHPKGLGPHPQWILETLASS